MLKAFLAVLEDLIEFVLAGFRMTTEPPVEAVPASARLQETEVSETHRTHVPLLNGQSAYVVADVPCRVRPVAAFDTVLGRLYYGEKISVLSQDGKFVYADSRFGKVWIEQAGITYHEVDILPNFLQQTFYFSDTSETKKVRAFLQDECAGEELHIPLQSVEYILFRLKKMGRNIDWGNVRPRTAGSWQKILRGKTGVYIGIEPKTHAVMEYFNSSQTGILAMVDSVHPDGTMRISSLGKEIEGQYLEETLEESLWRELRPVFISFT